MAYSEYEELMKMTEDLIVEVDGKVRAKIEVNRGISQSEAESLAVGIDRVAANIQGKKYEVIYVEGKIINFVISKRVK